MKKPQKLENLLNKIHNVDCIKGMKDMPEGCVDLVITSPPYNVGIPYDEYKDDVMTMDEYFEWCKEWLTEVYRTLKDDGRVGINVPYEVNVQERGGRVFIAAKFWEIMEKIGFGFFGMVDLEEDSPHRSKTTAWGSFMSPSSPYIYNPKECVILAYKKNHIKKVKGEPQWKYTEEVVEDEERTVGVPKIKRIYIDKDKTEFMELVFGQWKYLNDTKSLTKASFSLDIPMKAIKILTYRDEVVMDIFGGSCTSAIACLKTRRNYIIFELSKKYCEIGRKRISDFKYTGVQLNLFESEEEN